MLVLGNCNSFRLSPPTKVNVTQIKNWNTGSPAPPEWIPTDYTLPYSQYTPFCVPAYDCGNGVNGLRWCFPDIDDTYFQSASAGSGSFSVGKFHNVYSQSLDTGSFACQDDGYWKSVLMQSRYWVGRFGYTSREWRKNDQMDWCCTCMNANMPLNGFHTADLTPDTTKYCTVTAESTVEYNQDHYDVTIGDTQVECCCLNNGVDCGGCSEGSDGCECYYGYCVYKTYTDTTTYTAYGNSTCTVDVNGNMNGTCTSGSSGWCSESDPDLQYACLKAAADDGFSGVGAADQNYTLLQGLWCRYMQTWAGCEGCSPPDVLSWDESTGTGHAEWHTTVYNYDGCGCIVATRNEIIFEMTLTDTTFEAHGYGINNILPSVCPCDSYTPEWIELTHETWDFSATGISAESYGFNPSWSNAFFGTRNSTGTLSGTSTPSDVYSDYLTNICPVWKLGDTNMLPWQSGTAKTIMPWVGRDCADGAPVTSFCTSSNIYTGNIIGAPGPSGIDKIWDASHPNYCVCEDPNNPGCFSIYIDSYGAWNTGGTQGCGVPRATKWTDFFIANNLMDGAFLGDGWMFTMPDTCNSSGPHQFHNNCYFGVKTAYNVFGHGKQAYAWSRPCASDRWQVSASHTNCITDFTGDTVTVDITSGMNIMPGTASICGTANDGIYPILSVGVNTITLGDCMVSSSTFPWDLWTDCGSGWIGNIKYPNVPGICGTASIYYIEVLPSQSLQVSLSAPTWLITGGSLEVHSSSFVGANGTYTDIYMQTNESFVLSGSSVTESVGTRKTGGYVKVPGTPDEQWASTTPKCNLVSKKYSYNFRDVGEYQRLSSSLPFETDQLMCDAITPCTPSPLPDNPRVDNLVCGIPQEITAQSCDTLTLKYSQCGFTVIYYSPVSESFNSSSYNGGWSNPGLDADYETLWQAIPQQLMDDPLAPYQPCICGNNGMGGFDCSGCQYVADDGTCQADQADPCIHYYPAVDQFEAICAPPSGSPAPPVGTIIGCATTFPPSCSYKNVCSPPTSPGIFPEAGGCTPYLVYPVEIPWVLVNAKIGCVCGMGRFADAYQRNGCICLISDPP